MGNNYSHPLQSDEPYAVRELRKQHLQIKIQQQAAQIRRNKLALQYEDGAPTSSASRLFTDRRLNIKEEKAHSGCDAQGHQCQALGPHA